MPLSSRSTLLAGTSLDCFARRPFTEQFLNQSSQPHLQYYPEVFETFHVKEGLHKSALDVLAELTR